jgi:hypothetical protein
VADPDPLARLPPADSADPGPAALPDGIELGDVAPCAAPVPLGWSDVAPRGAAPVGPGDHFGALALLERGGERLVLHSEGDAVVAWAMPSGADRGRWTLPGRVFDLAIADVDLDGEPDLLVAADGGLFQIVDPFGEGQPVRVTPEDDPRTLHALLPVDLDLDGHAELIAGYIDPQWDPAHLAPEVLRLDGGPAAVSLADGDPGAWGMTFHLGAVDLDEDGLQDVYVCNDVGAIVNPNQLLRNDGAGGLVAATGTGLEAALSCMGHSFGDLDSDGDLDLYVAALEAHGLYLRGDAGAVDAGRARGLPPFVEHQMAWGSAAVDLDLDGRTDLAVATADFDRDGQAAFPLQLLFQGADGAFSERGAALGAPQASGGRGLIAAELNGDGVLDLVLADTDRPPHLLLSAGCTGARWLEVEAPAGTTARVWAGGRAQVASLQDRPGYRATAPARHRFGLGDLAEVDAVELILPGGDRVRAEGPFAADRALRWVGGAP